jgi:hypothetical protein
MMAAGDSTQSSWQTELDKAITIIEGKLNDIKELAEKHHEVYEDYQKEVDSWEMARRDIYHVAGTWTAKTRKW